MKTNIVAAFLFFSIILSSCTAVETVFKAGMWWAFFLVGLVVVLGLWIFFKSKKD